MSASCRFLAGHSTPPGAFAVLGLSIARSEPPNAPSKLMSALMAFCPGSGGADRDHRHRRRVAPCEGPKVPERPNAQRELRS